MVRTSRWLHTRATRDPIESQAHGRLDHELQLDNRRLSPRHSHQPRVNGALSISYWGEDRGRKRSRKGLGGIKTERLWGSGERMHSFIFKVKTAKYKCPIQVCDTPSASLWGASHSPETDHTHKQFITVCNKREETHFCLFSPKKKIKSNLYSWNTKVNSTVIKFGEWLCTDFLTPCLSRTVCLWTSHTAWGHSICCVICNLDLNLRLYLLR